MGKAIMTDQMKERLHTIDAMQEMARTMIALGDQMKKMLLASETATAATEKMNVAQFVSKRNRRVKYKSAS